MRVTTISSLPINTTVTDAIISRTPRHLFGFRVRRLFAFVRHDISELVRTCHGSLQLAVFNYRYRSISIKNKIVKKKTLRTLDLKNKQDELTISNLIIVHTRLTNKLTTAPPLENRRNCDGKPEIQKKKGGQW